MRILRRLAAAGFALLLGLVLLGGCEDHPPGETRTFTGVVQYHNAGMAIGGETDPYGHILAGDHGYDRLYLARQGDREHPILMRHEGDRVRVSGVLVEIEAGGVETPKRTFPQLEISSITPFQPEE